MKLKANYMVSCKHKNFLLLLFFLLPTLAYGNVSSTVLTPETFLGKTLQTFAMLGVVILLIFTLSYIVRKLTAWRTPLGSAIKMSAILTLGTSSRIALLEVKNVTLLVGITAQSINVLHVFSATDEK